MSEQPKSYLITRIKRGQTKTGKVVINFYAGGPNARLEYPVLQLFDPAMLLTVGIDPNDITAEESYCSFYAYYAEGEKINGKGNPYKDVLFLEPASQAIYASQEGSDTAAMLKAIKREQEEIKTLLVYLVSLAGGQPPEQNNAFAVYKFSNGADVPEEHRESFDYYRQKFNEIPNPTKFYKWLKS